MGISCRMYLIDKDDRPVRLKSRVFERLVRDPEHHAMPAMAGQRVHVAELLVELRQRIPVRIVRRVYFILAFDDAGRVDIDRLRKQQWALAESALAPVLAPVESDEGVSDAAARFIAAGGRWRPEDDLARSIDSLALGAAA